MEVRYVCPICSATKVLVKNPIQNTDEFLQDLPSDLPCGVKGCLGRLTKQGMKKCNQCGTTESEEWWKCCAVHTTEQGDEMVCKTCVRILHPDINAENNGQVTQ